MNDTDWSEVSSKKTKNRGSNSNGAPTSSAISIRSANVSGVKTGTGRKASVPQGKVFVGGMSWDTDEDSLRDYFSQYGHIAALEIPRGDNKVFFASQLVFCHEIQLPRFFRIHPQVPRGFAFVTFTDPDVVSEVIGLKHWIDNHPVEVKPAVGIGHEALQQPMKCAISCAAAGSKLAAGTVPEPSVVQPAQLLPQLNSNLSAPQSTAAAAITAPAISRPVTAWSGAVIKNAAAAATATLPAFSPNDFPPALNTKTTPATTAAPTKPTLSYASMVGRTPPTPQTPASQPPRSIASVGAAADMTSEHRR
jgi:hypothetical protein